VKDRVLRDEFVTNGITNRLGQAVAVPWDHSLRPYGYTEKFDRLVRMKQHPDREPRRAVSMHGRNNDDGCND